LHQNRITGQLIYDKHGIEIWQTSSRQNSKEAGLAFSIVIKKVKMFPWVWMIKVQTVNP
jgi:hypothetical protein